MSRRSSTIAGRPEVAAEHERATRLVDCPRPGCASAAGRPCRNPNGAPVARGAVHPERRGAAETWLKLHPEGS
jgi:hypothetical protein